jgi:hypothetical protein
MANIALNDAMILPYGANLSRMEFSERTRVIFAEYLRGRISGGLYFVAAGVIISLVNSHRFHRSHF